MPTRHDPRLGAASFLVFALAACGDSGTGTGVDPPGGDDPPRFLTAPIVGEPMVDVFYGAYMDHDPGAGAMDYACGIKAYSGHRGVDILLRNFREQDEGVAVVAAAPGDVVFVADGMPDRSTVWAGGGFGNHVVVRHEVEGERYVSIYAHLRTGSVSSEVGQAVGRGEFLGYVGSSGQSNWPHLHFEVQHDGPVQWVDPFLGQCGARASLWVEQLPYQNAFMVTDAGISDQLPLTYADLLERPPSVVEIGADADSVRFWIQLANQRSASMAFQVVSVEEDGDPAWEITGNVGPTFSMRYLTGRIPVAGLLAPGPWEVRVLQDGERIWTEPFAVAGPAPPASATQTDRGIVAGGSLEGTGIEVLDQGPAGPTGAPRPDPAPGRAGSR